MLSKKQQELVFDYCLGLASESAVLEAERLVVSSQKAAELCSALKISLSPLESLEKEICPDSLVESTVLRLKDSARSSHLQLEQLLADEQVRSVSARSPFWHNIGELLTAAAVILFVAGVVFAPLKHARQNYWQQSCQMQLGQIGKAIDNYRSDYGGALPAVATTAGEPWWKVGYQGKENHSNTRHLWLLAKGGYVMPPDFVCAGKREGQVIQLNPEQAKNYNDFPARRYVTYSLRIKCNNPQNSSAGGRKALVADLNPLFEKLPRNYSAPLKLRLNKALANFNSSNHNRRGQNILFGDSSVEFTKSRKVGITEDDIFTLQNTDVYKGIEIPKCEFDTFLAP